ncbi:hypothetical protein [Novosphingobium sp. ERW19]|uniref:hypothetical protein n=1 Tax=Novosphingobium sp. ERW19 TaxID=2726186 RepID=UPI001F0E5865|nr:hypothetical protein [Novosphingobium sp. ERW19]
MAGHQRGAITDSKAALLAVTDRPRRGLKIIEIGNDSACGLEEDLAGFGRFSAPGRTPEQFDAKFVFELQNASA